MPDPTSSIGPKVNPAVLKANPAWQMLNPARPKGSLHSRRRQGFTVIIDLIRS